MRVAVQTSIHDILIEQGYRLIDDGRERDGRRTYLREENASGEQISILKKHFENIGWKKDYENLWSFVHPDSGEIVELEPGGPETSGHFFHYARAFEW